MNIIPHFTVRIRLNTQCYINHESVVIKNMEHFFYMKSKIRETNAK